MDKIITLPDWVHIVSLIGYDNNRKCSEWYVPADLKDLNSDYINKHFGQLQEEAYQRGPEEGKVQSKCGCWGCEYECRTGEHLPCDYCMNNFTNQWIAMKHD